MNKSIYRVISNLGFLSIMLWPTYLKSICIRADESLEHFLKSHVHLQQLIQLEKRDKKKWEELSNVVPQFIFKKDIIFDLLPASKDFPRGKRQKIVEKSILENGCKMNLEIDLDHFIHPIHRPATILNGVELSYAEDNVDLSINYTKDQKNYFLKAHDNVRGIDLKIEALGICTPVNIVEFMHEQNIIFQNAFTPKDSGDCHNRDRIIIGKKISL